MMMKGDIIIFSDSKSDPRLDASSCPQDTGAPSLTCVVPGKKCVVLLDSKSCWY